MVPISLKLRNFMAYRNASLNFEGIHLAVLTGENGAGKSTLLDAITWSLWGKARARRDDDLIYLGQTEMEVEYTFGLGKNVYRVVRKRDASKRGRSDLSFQVQDAGGWRTLTENSIRRTQQKINHLLHLNYDTFINSAFLLQGRADEFTTKTPGKRKEILGEILGLGIYDIYEERAKKRANEKEKEARSIEGRIEQIEQELARESEYRQQLAEAQQAAAALNRQLQQAEREMEDLQEQHRALNEKQRMLDDLQDRLHRAEQDIAEATKDIADAQNKISEYQALLDRRLEIEAGVEQLAQARTAVKDWEARLHRASELSSRKHELDKALHSARTALESELSSVAATIDRLRPRVEAIDNLRAQLVEAEKELADLQSVEQDREAMRVALVNLDTEQARLEEQNKQLRQEMDEIKENLERLRQAESRCPVCKRPLNETHQAEVLAQFEREGKAKGDTYRANKARLQTIRTERTSLQQRLVEADRKLRNLVKVQKQIARLTQSLQDTEAAAEEIAVLRDRQLALQRQLESRDFAVEVLAELAAVEAELAELGYDRQAHEQVQQQAADLAHFEVERRLLAEAEKFIAAEKERMQRDLARQTRLQEQVEKDRQKVSELEKETAALPEIIARFNQASQTVDRLQQEERLARDRVASVSQQLHYIQEQAKKRSELDDQLEQVRESLGLYRELQQAFGKKGVQALLIESAIPEIEDEANRLLSRMTAGRMHIRFETQRAAKSSDNTIETLDIRISDELGTRDYELYSGGEAFRVNFAIRVAMSKVLARRAGARLQTLVIDEGFGTQDGQGRERLVEAINAIQDDFEKVIVITHIDELKEAFPARIEVWKTSDGSQAAVV